MKSEPALLNRHQSHTARATNSGPLSKRRWRLFVAMSFGDSACPSTPGNTVPQRLDHYKGTHLK